MRKPLAMRRNQAASSHARTLALLTAMAFPAVALAHPGHGDGGFWPGFLHVIHGADHVFAAIAVGAWGSRLGTRAVWTLPLAFMAAMAAGLGMAGAGIVLPMVEPMIAASLLLVGALIALDARCAAVIGALLAAAFALFHGAAHGAGMPGTASVLPFAAGLLVSTALAHASGIGIARALRGRVWALRLAAAPVCESASDPNRPDS